MRHGQTEFVGLSILVIIIVLFILFYVFSPGGQEGSLPLVSMDSLVIENYLPVLLQGDIVHNDIGTMERCKHSLSRLIVLYYKNDIEYIECGNTRIDIHNTIASRMDDYANNTLDYWGMTYEITIISDNDVKYSKGNIQLDDCDSIIGVSETTIGDGNIMVRLGICKSQ